MKFFVLPAILFTFFHLNQAGPLRLQKRAAFYIANETACVVDNTVYNSGDPIPTDDPCEACRCRPPGFACVLKECDSKPGCRAVRREGKCCPEYICGCEHNGRMYRDGDEIRDSQNPCYTCHCQGSSIACGFVDCFFRVDCAPEYVPGECCPRYDHCAALDGDNSTKVDYAFSTEKVYSGEETTVSPRSSESTPFSEVLENTEVAKENDKDSSVISPPESLDPSLLFSVNEEADISKDVQTTKKDTSTESVSDLSSEETSLNAESSEEDSSEKKVETVTELLKTDYEIINDEAKPKESETTPEQSPPEVGVDSETSVATDKNVEIFPVEESTTAEVKFKTAPPAEVTGQTTVPSTTELPDSLEDADDKANELIKRFRSLKNLTSDDDVTESPSENVDVKSEEAKDAGAKETTEKEATTAVTNKPSTVKLEKEIVVEDPKEAKPVDATTTEAVSKSETLYYNSDDKVETVTTVVEVREPPTSSEKADVEAPSATVSNEAEEIVFKGLSDAVEANNKQETTEKSKEETASQTTVGISDSTTPKVDDISTSSSLPSETDKSEEKVKLYADESISVPTTEAPKVTEDESNTTVVTEKSAEKVEPSKE